MPVTVSSTTAASSADSCCTPTMVGCNRVENRLAKMLSAGSDPSANRVSIGSMDNSTTSTANTVARLAMVSGTRTTAFWICWRSLLARLMS